MRLYSWNVNGIRAAVRNGLLEWLAAEQPDVLCLQEVKARPDDLDLWAVSPPGYESYWQPARRPGYSGVAAYVKRRPRSVGVLGDERFDVEGRVQTLEYPGFTLVNAYFPNSQPGGARLEYKLAFCDAMVAFCQALRAAGRRVVVCGDFNIAHTEIDLARPRENEGNPGYLPEERAAMTRFLDAGYIDTFRHFNPEPGHYTWWTYRANARARNVGWRIDYFCVDQALRPRLQAASIRPEVMGSDHCPVTLTLKGGAR